MSEVRYSINGKYFKDFGVYISESDGLFDQLKRKSVNSYDWAEYHGSAPDLSNPKFEAREITLKGFVVGENWEGMKSNFDAIISEFQKAGTQRLLIEPFGLKALPYEVYMDDSISLKKTFKNGKMVGTFTLKTIEPNPIKKILYFTGTSLNLSYTSPNETEIFYGNGLKETAKGNVSLSGKVLANHVVSGYGFEGRNLLLDSNKPLEIIASQGYGLRTYQLSSSVNIKNDDDVILIVNIDVFEAKNAQIWFEGAVKNGDDFDTYNFTTGYTENRTVALRLKKSSGKYLTIYNYGYQSTPEQKASQKFKLNWIKLVHGNKASLDWKPAPEEQKYIIIAGNIEEITDLTTNADKILWERL